MTVVYGIKTSAGIDANIFKQDVPLQTRMQIRPVQR